MKKNIFSGINIFHSKGKLRKLKVINHINKYKLECSAWLEVLSHVHKLNLKD